MHILSEEILVSNLMFFYILEPGVTHQMAIYTGIHTNFTTAVPVVDLVEDLDIWVERLQINSSENSNFSVRLDNILATHVLVRNTNSTKLLIVELLAFGTQMSGECLLKWLCQRIMLYDVSILHVGPLICSQISLYMTYWLHQRS